MGFSELKFLGQIASFGRRLRGDAPRPALSVPHLAGSGMRAERDKREVAKILVFPETYSVEPSV